MRTIATLLVLLAPALAAPREPVLTIAQAGGASPALPAPPGPPAAAPAPATSVQSALARSGIATPVGPPQAVLDKLGEGDRLYVAGDYAGALPVYLDAVYAQPKYAPGRVRLGRTYLALRYADRAVEQAELALALDPSLTDAAKLLAEAKGQAASGATGVIAAPPPQPAAPAPAKPGPKSYKLTPDDAKPASAAVKGAAAAAAPAPSPRADPEGGAAHYRTAIGLLQNREWEAAVAELSAAVAADPRLAVAYSARGSALFGLGRYMEAADDYDKAIALDSSLGTPVYGLAECYRMLGDSKHAAQLYDQYAKSSAADVREDLRANAAKRAKELK